MKPITTAIIILLLAVVGLALEPQPPPEFEQWNQEGQTGTSAAQELKWK